MSTNPYQAFISLVNLDQEIRSLDLQIRKIEREVAELTEQQKENAAAVQLAKNDLHDARVAVDSCELEMRELDEQLTTKKAQLENVSNQKEYTAVKTEIDAIKKKQHGLEGALLDTWRVLETRTKEHDIKRDIYEKKESELSAVVSQHEVMLNTVREQMHEKELQRPALEENVPAEWLEKYRLMRSAVSNPVVPVDRGCCSACYNTLPEQVLSDLRHRKLMQCKYCYRLLYAPEALT